MAMSEELQTVTEALIECIDTRADIELHETGDNCPRCQHIGWITCHDLLLVRERDLKRRLATARTAYYHVAGRTPPAGFSDDGEMDTWPLRI
jgi:hypothetical protein